MATAYLKQKLSLLLAPFADGENKICLFKSLHCNKRHIVIKGVILIVFYFHLSIEPVILVLVR